MTPALLAQSSIKMSCIVMAALVAASIVRRSSAAVRHWILAAGVVCAAGVPLVEPWLPSWSLPVTAISARTGAATTAEPRTPRNAPLRQDNAALSGARSLGAAYEGAVDGRRGVTVTTENVVVAIWIGGTAVSLLLLAAGLCRLAWISAAAKRLKDGPWVLSANAMSRRMGLRRGVRILQADRAGLLFTWGALRPAIVVPPDANRWPLDRVRIVLAHELAHVRRGDWLVQLVGESVRAACWFNPVVWIAARRLRQEGEQAADDAVIETGIDGGEYATHLVELARAFASRRGEWLPAPAIVRRSSFERRVRAMLDVHANRRPVSLAGRIGIGGVLLAGAVAIAAAQGLFSTFSGTVYDPLNGLLPNVRMTLTNTQTAAKYEVRTDRNGRFEFVGLPPARYELETALMGFMPLRASVEIAGQNIQRDMTLTVGSLQETLTVSPGDETPTNSSGPRATTTEALLCRPPETGGIGGNLRAPTKLVHVRPQFPPALAATGATGLVVLDATIGVDGTIRDIRTQSSTDSAFEAATIDAVRQWAFSQTLLNCVPVEVKMTITARFAAR